MTVQSNPGESPRAGRPNGRGRRAGPSGRRLTLAMATALAIAGTAVTLTAVAGLAAWQAGRALTALERAEHAATAEQTRWQLQSLTARDEARLADAAFSDALYADLGRLAERRDTAFRPGFAERFAQQHRDQFIGVYDLQGNPLYRWTAAGSLGLDGTIVANPLFRVLDNREATAGLLRRGDELFWVAGAPVLPTSAPASAPIRGYVLTARPARPADFSPVHAGRPMPVDISPITPTRAPARTQVNSLAGGDSVRITFPLADIFAERSSEATIRADRSAFRAVERRVQLLFAGTLIAIGLLAVLGWWLARRWIVRPVTRFAESLEPIHEGQSPPLLPVVSAAAEWQTAVGAVNRLLSHTRASSERNERLAGAARDGVWSCEIATDTWTFNDRFRELLGRDQAGLPTGRAGLLDLIHPDHRQAASEALERCTSESAPLSVEAQIRRGDGGFGWYRLAAQVHADHAGVPSELVGRLVSLDDERAGRDRTEALHRDLVATQRGHGQLLTAVARQAPEGPWTDDLGFIGQALAGSVSPSAEPFDLHQLLQELGESAEAPVRVAISPGLSTRVIGDRALIARALDPLVAHVAAAGGEVTLRAECADGAGGRVKLLVENDAASGDASERTRVAALLGTGALPETGPVTRETLALLAAHHALSALGATAGLDAGGGAGIRGWVALDLPAAAPEYAGTALPDFGDVAPAAWQDPADWPEADTVPAPAPASSPAPEEPRVELVADATVTINLDDTVPPAPAAPQVIDPAFLAQLQPGDGQSVLALQMATAFLADAPERARGLRLATSEGEVATARALAGHLGGMAGLVTAEALAAACRAFVEAASHSSTGLAPRVAAVDAAVDAVTAALEGVLEPATRPSAAAGPPINADTLAQLRASIAADRLGMGGQLISMFIAEAPLRVEALERAAMGRDGETVRSTAADLRNMCSLVGAGALGARCEALDMSDPDPEQVAGIRAELDRARQALEELLQAGAHA